MISSIIIIIVNRSDHLFMSCLSPLLSVSICGLLVTCCPQVACENTAAATTAGLAAGMNAVEVDVSVSRDNVVFLWNDPMPLDPIAQSRR